MLTTIRRAEYFELVVLFFIHAMAMGMWFVPLGAVLDAHGMAALKPYAFATNALAAFVSPLIFGAMADRHHSPVVVLRGLAVASTDQRASHRKPLSCQLAQVRSNATLSVQLQPRARATPTSASQGGGRSGSSRPLRSA